MKNLKTLVTLFRNLSLVMLFLAVVSHPSRSQSVRTSKDFKIKLSTPYKVIDATSKNYFNYENTIISVKLVKKKIFIQKFDTKTMREVNMREVTDMPDDFVTEGMVQAKDKILFFYSLWDKKAKVEQLFVRDIDFDKGNFTAPATKILTIEGKLTGTLAKTSMFGYGMEVTDKFNFDVAFDSTKLVVRYRKKPETRDDSKSYDVIGMNVFNYDNGLKKLWSKEITMPYTELRMDEVDFTVDSEGNAYMLAKVFKGDKKAKVKDKDGFVLYSMEMFKIDAKTQELKISKVDLPAKFINEIILFESAGQVLTLTGYYNNGNKKEGGVDGIFLAKVSPAGEVTDMRTYEIPLEIINQNISKRAAEKNKKKEEDDDEDSKGAQLQSLKFRWAESYTDGSLVIVGEQYRVVERRHVDSKGNVRVSYTYYYEDILVTKVNPKGELVWMKRLPKTQRGARGLGGMSFKHIKSNDYHYFLYLDNVKNLNLPDDKEPAVHQDGAGGYLTAYKVSDSNGEVSKVSIFDTKSVNGTEVFQFAPSRISKISATDFMLEVYKKDKEDIMIKISIVEPTAEK